MMLVTGVMDVCGEEVFPRATALQSIAHTLRHWSTDALQRAEHTVKASPAHLECNAVLQMGHVDSSGVQALVELLKLMPQDVAQLKTVLVEASPRQLSVVALVATRFGTHDQGLYQLKQLMDSPNAPLASAAVSLVDLIRSPADMSHASSGTSASSSRPTPTLAAAASGSVSRPMIASTPMVDPAVTMAIVPPGTVGLRFTRQPEMSTVYHKILKPFPTLELIGDETIHEWHVVAELFKAADGINADWNESLPYLEGERVVPIKNKFAVFRKLKISMTTTSVGAPFVLRFTICQDRAGKILVPGTSVHTGPLNVYSHTSYLKGKDGPKKDNANSNQKRKRKDDDDFDDDDE